MTASDPSGTDQNPAPEVVVRAAIANPCGEEHTVHQGGEENGSLPMWVTCGTATMATQTFDVASSADISQDIRWWMKSVMDGHREALAPTAVLAAVRALPVEQRMAAMGMRRAFVALDESGRYFYGVRLMDDTEIDPFPEHVWVPGEPAGAPVVTGIDEAPDALRSAVPFLP